MGDINDSICRSKEASFSETVIPSTERICTAPTDDNMVQQRNIHRSRRLPQLPRKLNIRGAGRWISAGVVLWVNTY
jgi:hypothetical protein